MPIITTPTGYETPTLDDLVDEILDMLHGYSQVQPQVSSLTADITATDTTIPVDDAASGFGAGEIEIGDEVIRVKSADTTGNTVTTLPQGRGWRGSTAATHSLGDTVTIRPVVPRFRVKRAVNDVISQLYPNLWAVGSTSITPTANQRWAPTFDVPAEAEFVSDVRIIWPSTDPRSWYRARHWEASHKDVTGTSGYVIRLFKSIPNTATLQIIYGKRPTALSSGTSALTDSGLEISSKYVIVYGVLVRLLPSLDIGRLRASSASAQEMSQPVQMGSGTNLAREAQRQYNDQLKSERLALQRKCPPRTHYEGSRL